jgi:hypothetical protein
MYPTGEPTMSRTLRRNKKHLILDKVGTIDDFVSWRYRRFTPEVGYKRAVHRYTRDRHSGVHHVPRWWRKLHFVDPERRAAKQEIQRCLSQSSFDDHLDPRYRGANWLWHWYMS